MAAPKDIGKLAELLLRDYLVSGAARDFLVEVALREGYDEGDLDMALKMLMGRDFVVLRGERFIATDFARKASAFIKF
jgi:hypothetical protein